MRSFSWIFIYFIRNIVKLTQSSVFKCIVLQMSPFSTYDISTPSPHSRVQSVPEEGTTGWGVEKNRTSQQEATDMSCSLQSSSKERKISRFLPPPHVPLLQANSQPCPAELLACCAAFRWESSALHCQTFIPEQWHFSPSHPAFRLWHKESMYGLTQCIIQRTFLPQRGESSLQKFCVIKQRQFLKLFFRFLVWHVNPKALLC